jgi:7-cyano-7-deazaguanine synthase in queuosine biosynthesis
MNAIAKRHIILCNGAPKSTIRKKTGDAVPIILDYRDEDRVLLHLPRFIISVGTVPQRVLDLLELCAYVFAADRLVSRGQANSVVFDAWSRTFHFAVKVRDFDFWNDPVTKKKLSELLEFISGDRQFKFEFVAGHATPPAHLFDREDCFFEPSKPHHVMLFSGGLDSLAGAIERLNTTDDTVCLISHRSGQPSTAMTQDKLVTALKQQYPGRVEHYKFSTSLTNGRAVSETQRTRTFIYGSIAFALASALKQDHISFYENGITSLNFPRRQDLLNSRASRTTHPKTMILLGEFLSHVAEKQTTVTNTYRWKTKADVLDVIKSFNAQNLIPSAVTCSITPMTRGEHTHCGGCFQCIDRRFSASAVDLTDVDYSGLYTFDFLSESISDPQIKTAIIDYVRLGIEFNDSSIDSFYNDWLTEIAEAMCTGDNEVTFIPKLYGLVKRFGQQTVHALNNFNLRDDVTKEPIPNTLLQIIHHREYLKDEPERFALSLSNKLKRAIPSMFIKNRPRDENDFNDKLNGLIQNDNEGYRREFPVTSFGLAKVIPDHEVMKCNLIIESKYLRSNTTASKITESIAADLVKYPEAAYIVFVIYDPDRSIKDDHVFIRDIEAKRKSCMVSIIR